GRIERDLAQFEEYELARPAGDDLTAEFEPYRTAGAGDHHHAAAPGVAATGHLVMQARTVEKRRRRRRHELVDKRLVANQLGEGRQRLNLEPEPREASRQKTLLVHRKRRHGED